jgi:large subunit ribosomal protein L30
MAKLLVVNFHGLINVPMRTRTALEELGVTRKFSATVVPDDDSTAGVLRRCKDYVAWAEIDKELLTLLLTRNGRLSQRRRLDEASLKSLGFKDYGELASKIIEDGKRLSSVEGILPFFRLRPPVGGFKRSTRRQFGEGGVLGANPELPGLIRRMI